MTTRAGRWENTDITIQVRFIAYLKAKQMFAENLLSIGGDCESWVGGVIERNADEPFCVCEWGYVWHCVEEVDSDVDCWSECLLQQRIRYGSRAALGWHTGSVALPLFFRIVAPLGRPSGWNTAFSWELPPTRIKTLPPRDLMFARRLRKAGSMYFLE